MSNRKLLAVSTLTLSAALVLPGCGGSEDQTPAAPPAPAPAENTNPQDLGAQATEQAKQAVTAFSQEAQTQAQGLIQQVQDHLGDFDLQNADEIDGLVQQLKGLQGQVSESTQTQIDNLVKQYETYKTQAADTLNDLQKKGGDLLKGLGQ